MYNGHLQSLGAVGIVYIASVVGFGKNPGLDLLFLVYCVFQIIYFFDRYWDLEKDKSTNAVRSKHIMSYKTKIPFIIFIYLSIVVVGNILFGNFGSLVSSLAVTFLGVMYPLYAKGYTKKVFMFKNIYVSSVHALLVFYPLVYYSMTNVDFKVWAVFLLVLVEVVIMQLALDTKDISSDKKIKLLTFPVVFGFNNTLRAINILNVFSFAIFVYLGIRLQMTIVYQLVAFECFVINIYMSKRIQGHDISGILAGAAKFATWLPMGFVVQILLG